MHSFISIEYGRFIVQYPFSCGSEYKRSIDPDAHTNYGTDLPEELDPIFFKTSDLSLSLLLSPALYL